LVVSLQETKRTEDRPFGKNGKMDSAALAQALWADIGAQRWDALAAYFLLVR
jgi:hypothetical protein